MATTFRPSQLYDFSNDVEARVAYERRWKDLKAERSTWDKGWKSLAENLLPASARLFTTDKNQASQDEFAEIYDNTGVLAFKTLAAGMLTGASSPGRPWFKLTTKDAELSAVHNVKLWLEESEDRMRRVFDKSNVYRRLQMIYREDGVFGTSGTVMMPHPERVIHLYPVAPASFALQKNAEGEIVTMYRTFDMSAGEVAKAFGKENCSNSVQQKLESRSLDRDVTILHVIEPRADQERDPGNPSPKHMPYRSVYMEYGTEDADRGFLRDSGFEYFPVLAPRWDVLGEDTYGYGPGSDVLGDAKQLKFLHFKVNQGIDHENDPALVMPAELKGQEKQMRPGGRVFGKADQIQFIRRLHDTTPQIDKTFSIIEDIRLRIRAGAYADLFRMLTHPTMYMRDKTKHEVQEMAGEKLAELGPVLGRLQNELFGPLIENTFFEMEARGMIPPPPDELQGQELDIEYIGPLVMAQKALALGGTTRFLASMVELGQFKPEVLDRVDWDDSVDTMVEMEGVPASMVVPIEDAEQVRRARAAMEAQERALVNAETASKAASNLANAPVGGGSALDQVLSPGGQ